MTRLQPLTPRRPKQSHLEYTCHHAEGRRALEGLHQVMKCFNSKGPQVPAAQNSLARAGHRAPPATKGPGNAGLPCAQEARSQHPDLGGLPGVCSTESLAHVLCPAASPCLPESPRLPTSPLDSPEAQDHSRPAGVVGAPLHLVVSRGAHTGQPTPHPPREGRQRAEPGSSGTSGEWAPMELALL